MATPEGKVKREIKLYLDGKGEQCWYFMPTMMGYGRKGVPDFIGCLRGEFFAIEVKAAGKKHNTTVWQDRELMGIFLAGGNSFVADDIETVRRKLA